MGREGVVCKVFMSAARMWVKLCGNCVNGLERREARNGGKKLLRLR